MLAPGAFGNPGQSRACHTLPVRICQDMQVCSYSREEKVARHTPGVENRIRRLLFDVDAF